MSATPTLSGFVHDVNQFVLAEPTAAATLVAPLISALKAAKAEALEVGDNESDRRGGGEVDLTFNSIRAGVRGFRSAGVLEKHNALDGALTRLTLWDELGQDLRRIRAWARDRTAGRQVASYLRWCVELLGAFRCAVEHFPPYRGGIGWVARRERQVLYAEVHPRAVEDWNDTPYGRAVAEVVDMRGHALPRLERLHTAIQAAARTMRRMPRGQYVNHPEVQALNAAIEECLPLAARPSDPPPPVRDTPASPATEPRGSRAVNASSSNESPSAEPSGKLPDRRHAPDFRSVYWDGQECTFTPKQAACVRVLWEAFEGKTPDVGDEYLLEIAGSETRRLVDLFRNHPAWGTMIVSGATKGTRRLAALSEA